MKIILEFNEYLLLRRLSVKGDGATTTSRPKDDVRMITEFYDGGLIRGIPLQPFDSFGPIYITPLGRRVLLDHTPYLDPINARDKLMCSDDNQMRTLWSRLP